MTAADLKRISEIVHQNGSIPNDDARKLLADIAGLGIALETVKQERDRLRAENEKLIALSWGQSRDITLALIHRHVRTIDRLLTESRKCPK